MQIQSRITIFAAIVGLLALMGGLFVFVDNTSSLETAQIELQEVELRSSNKVDKSVELYVTFLVANPSDTTFTVPSITYDLYADGVLLGASSYSTEDISMPGRAAFYSGVEIPLKSKITANHNEQNAQVLESIAGGEEVEYTASGILTLQTTWSVVDIEF